MHHLTLRGALRLVLPTAAVAVLPAAAGAATPASFSCAATAASVQALGGATQRPVTAGADGVACRAAASGFQDAADVTALTSKIDAATAYAVVDPGGDRPAASSPKASAGVEGLSTESAGLPLKVSLARSAVTASCANGRPAFSPSSVVGSITLGDTPLVIDGAVQPITDRVSDALGGSVSVRLNETVDLPGGGKAVRAAHIKLGDAADVIVAESRLDAVGAACDPSAGGDPSTITAIDPAVCPNGSVFDAGRTRCVIPVPGSQTSTNPIGDLAGSGSVVVGPPSGGPSGGSVLTLAVARKRFPRSPCVRGAGPAYVVVGTPGNDRITGTNHADRILGLGGNDHLDAGRGNDCVEGDHGRDAMTGGQGDDRVYGGTARDLVNGDGGNDRLYGGSGNDTLNAAYGADRVFGGAGRDKINVATAGRVATVHGGGGWDKVRCNPHELRRIHGVERVIVTRRVR